jgi:hypothetical protein
MLYSSMQPIDNVEPNADTTGCSDATEVSESDDRNLGQWANADGVVGNWV